MYVHGTFNVAKCVTYLRSVGAEITDEMAQEWTDAERVHRWLRNEKKAAKTWKVMRCRRGHEWTRVFVRPARSKAAKEANAAATVCPECGDIWCIQSPIAVQARDGTVRDYRPPSERWRPLDDDAHATTPPTNEG